MTDEKIIVKEVITCDLSEDERELVSAIKLVDNADGLTQTEKPVYLWETGNENDLKTAKKLVAKQLLKKVLDGSATAGEINRYNALKS